MKMHRFLPAFPFILFYEGDPAATGDDDAKKAADDAKKAADDAKKAKTYTQEEFNTALAEDRRKHKLQLEKQIKQLEDLQKAKGLTEKEKSDLATRIEELQSSMLTKEQLAAKEREKLESSHKTEKQTLTHERDTWQNRFVKSTINTAIISEAIRAEAFDSEALIAILGPNTRLVEEVDEAGKGTDSFTTKVKFADRDAEDKPVTLDLTVEQAIKRMKEIPRYGYLFKSTAAGGLGGTPIPGKGGKVDVSKMTTEQYREHRKKLGLARKANS